MLIRWRARRKPMGDSGISWPCMRRGIESILFLGQMQPVIQWAACPVEMKITSP
jgi:hypothetical protein